MLNGSFIYKRITFEWINPRKLRERLAKIKSRVKSVYMSMVARYHNMPPLTQYLTFYGLALGGAFVAVMFSYLHFYGTLTLAFILSRRLLLQRIILLIYGARNSLLWFRFIDRTF